MLPMAEARGFRLPGNPGAIPVSQTIAQGVLSLVFALLSPHGGFYGYEPTPYPPRSHAVSAGLTSRMPYARGMVQLTQRVRQQIKDGLKKVYLVFCDLSKLLCGCAAQGIGLTANFLISPWLKPGALRKVW